jgi:two-component system, NarL family, nitrate/nitrite response regulator NarP
MRIILADHHADPRWALKMLLEEHPEFDMVGEAMDSPGLLVLAQRNSADLILVDIELPGMHINDLIARLHALKPRPIIMVMSSKPDDNRPLLNAGADAFVCKTDRPDWLLDKLFQYAEQVRKE